MIKLTRAVILESYPFTERKLNTIVDVFNDYKEILKRLVNIALENKIRSHIKLRKIVYDEIREEYKDIPTHYIYTACQDAITRVNSFLRLKKKGIAKTDKLEIRSVSLWLDDVLWDVDRFPRFKERRNGQKTLFVRVSTKQGRITLPLKPHKLFFKYLSNGWIIKANVKLRVDRERKNCLCCFYVPKGSER